MSDKAIAPAPGVGTVRLVNGASFVGAVDAYANGSKLFSDVAFATAAVASNVGGGAYNLAIDPTGSTTALFTAPVHVSNGLTYDAIVAGGSGGTQLVGGQTTAAGNHLDVAAAVRVFDGIDPSDIVAAGDTSFKSVTVALNGAANSYSFSMSEFGSAPVSSSSSTPVGYMDIAPDTYQVIVTSGTDTSQHYTASLPLSAGQVRTLVVAAGSVSGVANGQVIIIADQQ